MPARKLKFALMAASALAASGAVVHASSPGPATEIVQAVHAADETPAAKPMPAAQKLGIAAAATALLAALAHIVGIKRIRAAMNAAGPVAAKAARAVAAAPVAAARAVGRAALSPLRFLMLTGGLAAFSLTGLWLFDLEWAGGLVAGAALAALGVAAAAPLMRRRPAPARVNQEKSGR